eukprot:6257903-Amphidinium_carterae.2
MLYDKDVIDELSGVGALVSCDCAHGFFCKAAGQTCSCGGEFQCGEDDLEKARAAKVLTYENGPHGTATSCQA